MQAIYKKFAFCVLGSKEDLIYEMKGGLVFPERK